MKHFVLKKRLFFACMGIYWLVTSAVYALDLSGLSNKEASGGVKAALENGAIVAISKLGVTDGFLRNDAVKIHLPSVLEKARPILKMMGKGGQLDDLVVSMNRAAESAIPMAKPLLLNAVKSMSIADAKNILTGGETSVTDFFKNKTSEQLNEKFLPIVKGVTDKSGLSLKYNAAMGKAQNMGVVATDEATVERYVTKRAMDGLYRITAEEEKKIRRDPLSAGSQIIGKVFGSIK